MKKNQVITLLEIAQDWINLNVPDGEKSYQLWKRLTEAIELLGEPEE